MSNIRPVDRMSRTPAASGGRLVMGVVAVVVAIVFVIGIAMTGLVVTAGNVGVVTTLGKVEDGVLYPGFYLRVPFVQQIHQIDVRVQPHPFKSIDAASQEQQSVKLTGMLNYSLAPERANELYQTVGLDFASKVIDPAFSDFIKEVVPKFPVTEILQRRDEIRQQTKERLAANLDQYGIVVKDVYISDIAFSQEYQAAIEQKQTAQQNVGKETQVLAQRQIQAQQKVAEAKGDADSTIERARGEAEANRVRAASISSGLIDYLQATKWDGKLPQVTGGAIPFFDVQAASDRAVTAAPAAAPSTPAQQPASAPAGR